MQKLGFILFLLGAGGMDSPNMAVPAVMVLVGLAMVGISALKERRKKGYDETGINSERHCGDVQHIREQKLHHNKTA